MLNRMLRHALVTMMPPTEALPGIADTHVELFLVQFRREADPLFKVGFYVSSGVFVFLPAITVGYPLPTFLMPESVRDRYADAFAMHPLYPVRQLGMVLKTVGGLCWAAHPSVRSGLGLEPYPLDPGTWRPSSGPPPVFDAAAAAWSDDAPAPVARLAEAWAKATRTWFEPRGDDRLRATG